MYASASIPGFRVAATVATLVNSGPMVPVDTPCTAWQTIQPPVPVKTVLPLAALPPDEEAPLPPPPPQAARAMVSRAAATRAFFNFVPPVTNSIAAGQYRQRLSARQYYDWLFVGLFFSTSLALTEGAGGSSGALTALRKSFIALPTDEASSGSLLAPNRSNRMNTMMSSSVGLKPSIIASSGW